MSESKNVPEKADVLSSLHMRGGPGQADVIRPKTGGNTTPAGVGPMVKGSRDSASICPRQPKAHNVSQITNAVRGGSPPFVADPQGSSCKAISDPNYRRLQFYKDELQWLVENDPHVSERVLAKYELICLVLERWE